MESHTSVSQALLRMNVKHKPKRDGESQEMHLLAKLTLEIRHCKHLCSPLKGTKISNLKSKSTESE